MTYTCQVIKLFNINLDFPVKNDKIYNENIERKPEWLLHSPSISSQSQGSFPSVRSPGGNRWLETTVCCCRYFCYCCWLGCCMLLLILVVNLCSVYKMNWWGEFEYVHQPKVVWRSDSVWWSKNQDEGKVSSAVLTSAALVEAVVVHDLVIHWCFKEKWAGWFLIQHQLI